MDDPLTIRMTARRKIGPDEFLEMEDTYTIPGDASQSHDAVLMARAQLSRSLDIKIKRAARAITEARARKEPDPPYRTTITRHL